MTEPIIHEFKLYNHRPFAAVYADEATRLAAAGFNNRGSFLTEDLHKTVLQLDDMSVWALTAVTPTWTAVGAAGGGGGYPFTVATVDPTNPEADYSTITAAAASAASVILIGPGSYEELGDLNIGNKTLVGMAGKPGDTYIWSEIGAEVNGLITSNCTLVNLYIEFERAGNAVAVSGASPTLINTTVSCYSSGGTSTCFNSAATLYGGRCSANNAANTATIATSTLLCYETPVLSGPNVATTNFIRGVWHDTSQIHTEVAGKFVHRVPHDDIAATTYTFIYDDQGRLKRSTSGSATTFTVPPDSTTNWLVGTRIEVEQAGTGALTIAEGIGVTINSLASAKQLAGRYAQAGLRKVAANTWSLTGQIT